MRKLVVCMLTSLDGFASGNGDDFTALPVDDSFSDYNVTRLRAADALLLGATTFRGFLAYWPPVEDDGSQPPVEREIAAINNRIHKVVVSDSLTAQDTGVWRSRTELVARADAHRRVAELRNGDGGDILVFGSLTLWNDLLAAGLVDELHVMVGAGVLAAGRRAFLGPYGGQAFDGDLTLTGLRRLEGSQTVLLTYAVDGAGPGYDQRRPASA